MRLLVQHEQIIFGLMEKCFSFPDCNFARMC